MNKFYFEDQNYLLKIPVGESLDEEIQPYIFSIVSSVSDSIYFSGCQLLHPALADKTFFCFFNGIFKVWLKDLFICGLLSYYFCHEVLKIMYVFHLQNDYHPRPCLEMFVDICQQFF